MEGSPKAAAATAKGGGGFIRFPHTFEAEELGTGICVDKQPRLCMSDESCILGAAIRDGKTWDPGVDLQKNWWTLRGTSNKKAPLCKSPLKRLRFSGSVFLFVCSVFPLFGRLVVRLNVVLV